MHSNDKKPKFTQKNFIIYSYVIPFSLAFLAIGCIGHNPMLFGCSAIAFMVGICNIDN